MTDPTSLDNLHDIIPLAHIPLWPPAPGWYVVAFALGAATAWGAATAYLRWKGNRYRRDALAELALIEKKARDNAPARDTVLQKLPELVKRTALAAYSRESVASLTGEEWLSFLDKSLSTTEFTYGPGRFLVRIAYQNRERLRELSATEVGDLLALVRRWTRHHEAGPQITAKADGPRPEAS